MTQSEVTATLWKSDWTLQALVVLILAFIGMLVPQFGVAQTWYYRECGVVFGILSGSVFDSIGFHLTETRDEDISVNRSRYRVIQNMEQYIAYALVGICSGWFVALGCFLCWWLCGNDYAFYVLRKEPAYGGELTWVSWSIPGLLGIKVFWKQFVTSAIIGYLVAIGSAFL